MIECAALINISFGVQQGCGSGIASTASNRTWTLTELGLYLIYELADKHYYQN